jgi:hypothetical protein
MLNYDEHFGFGLGFRGFAVLLLRRLFFLLVVFGFGDFGAFGCAFLAIRLDVTTLALAVVIIVAASTTLHQQHEGEKKGVSKTNIKTLKIQIQ